MRRDNRSMGRATVPTIFRQRAAADAQQEFQLERTILSVAKADSEEGVGVIGGVDVGYAPFIAVNVHLGGETGKD